MYIKWKSDERQMYIICKSNQMQCIKNLNQTQSNVYKM